MIKMWRSFANQRPILAGYIFGLLAVVIPIIGSTIYQWNAYEVVDGADAANTMLLMTRGIIKSAPVVALFVLFFGAVNYFFSTQSFERIRKQFIGEHHAYGDFTGHIYDLSRFTKSNDINHFYMILSTLAYGIGAKDPRCAEEFLKIIENFLDKTADKIGNWDAKETRRVILKIFIWDEISHRNTFGFEKNAATDVQEKVMEKLEQLLSKMSDLDNNYEHFEVRIMEIAPLDWRLFLLDGQDFHYGLTAVFSRLTKKSIKDGEWKTAAYSSKSSSAFMHFNALVQQIEASGAKDISSRVLSKPANFVAQWFYKDVTLVENDE